MSFKDYIVVDLICEEKRHFEIKDTDGQYFTNNQFNNEALKKLSMMTGFKIVNKGFGFYFRSSHSKMIF